MASSRPSFRVMRNGYDRFAVDAAIDDYVDQVEQLKKQLELYQKNNEDLTSEFNNLKNRYQSVMSGLMARERAADDISRIALKEANQIIDAARNNADMIVGESLVKAQLVLADLVKISNETGSMKKEMKDQLEQIMNDIDSLRSPDLPDLSWLENARKKYGDD